MIISIPSQRGPLALVVVLGVVILPQCADAFVTPSPSCVLPKVHSTTTTLALSYEGGTGGEDEISKLIGKRNQIKRKSKQEEEVQSTTTPPEPEIANINWDAMPELRTKREARKQKDETSDDDNDKSTNKRQKEDILAYDFMVDYDDENDFHIPNRIGFSTQGWGDPKSGFVSSGKLTKRMIKAKKYVAGDLQLAYNLLLEGGISLVETSSMYGKASQKDKLSAHDILKTCIKEYDADDTPPLIVESVGASSILPPRAAAIRKRAEQSCDNLGIDLVDLLQVRKTLPALSRGIPAGIVAAMEGGSCSYVGVAGILQKSSLKRFASQVERQGGTLVSNAFEFSLTNLKSEYMIDACKELNVIPLIFNPLDGGLASGVYTATNPSGGEVGSPQRFKFEQLEKLQPLHSVMETVAERVATRVGRENRDIEDRYRGKGPAPRINTDITTTQVAINYVVAKGGVPIQQVNTPKQAEELLGCLGWTLLENEVDMLDSAAALCTQ